MQAEACIVSPANGAGDGVGVLVCWLCCASGCAGKHTLLPCLPD